jgi:hypothetical protein
MKITRFIFPVCILIISSCGGGTEQTHLRDNLDRLPYVETNYFKDTIEGLYGPPDQKKTVNKSGIKSVVGNEFLSTIPDQAEIEIWQYYYQDKYENLYFINGSNKISHITYHK